MQNPNDNHEKQAFIQPNQQPVLYPSAYSNQPVGVQVVHQPQEQWQTPPKPYLAWSILNIICCSLVFGIIALVYSVKTESSIRERNYHGAVNNSRMSKTFNIVGTVTGLVCYVILVLIVIFYAALFVTMLSTAKTYGYIDINRLNETVINASGD